MTEHPAEDGEDMKRAAASIFWHEDANGKQKNKNTREPREDGVADSPNLRRS